VQLRGTDFVHTVAIDSFGCKFTSPPDTHDLIAVAQSEKGSSIFSSYFECLGVGVAGFSALAAFCAKLPRSLAIRNREGHRVAHACEAFLLAGSDAYKKQGGKFVKRTLTRLITKSTVD
jgi:hypothetical protein